MNVLGIMQLVFSLAMLVFFFVLKVPVILQLAWQTFVSSNEGSKNNSMEQELEKLIHPSEYSTTQTRYQMNTKGPYSDCFQIKGKRHFGSLFGYCYYYTKSFILLFRDSSLIYLCFYIVCSVVGFFYSPIFYCFHLLDIIHRFPMLQNVILSVSTNFRQLVLTFLLGVIMIYVFTIVGYRFLFADWYSGDVGDEGENMCTSLFQCFLWTFDFGLRNGGGISESLRIMSYESENRDRYYVRFIFDVLFFSLINVIFLNIIFGTIIDTFAELRDGKKQMYEDIKNKCFICGLDRAIFDKNADGFGNHQSRDHNMWNYIFYIFYLKNKDATEYNGIESYVSDKLESNDISWFPNMKSISLGSAEQGEEKDNAQKQVEEESTEVQQQLNALREKLKLN